MLSPPIQKPRMTVVSKVYYAGPRQQTHDPNLSFSRFLEGAEEPYRRTTTVGEDWQELDLGWLKDRQGFLCVKNDEGSQRRVNPTEDELIDSNKRVLELGTFPQALEVAGAQPSPFARIRPGESCQFEPCTAARLRIRCKHGSVRVVFFAIPE